MIKRGFLKDAPFGSKIGVLFGMVVVLLIISQMITMLLLMPYLSLNDLTNESKVYDFSNPGIVNALKWSQIVSAIFTFIIPSWLFSVFVSDNSGIFLKLKQGSSFILFLLSGIAMIVALPLINWLSVLNEQLPLPQWAHDMEAQAEKLTDAFLKMDTIGDLILNIIMVGLLAAVGEEMLFRGSIQRVLGDIIKNKHIVIWVAAALFSAFHMQFAGFIPRMFIGALLGYLFEWTGSLWVPIFVHFTNNSFAVAITYLSAKGFVSADIDKIGVNDQQEKIFVYASIALLIPIIYTIYRITKVKTVTQSE